MATEETQSHGNKLGPNWGLFDELNRIWSEEDGGKSAAAHKAGIEKGLLPGWDMGAYFYSIGKNGEIREGTSKHPVPMYCCLCGDVFDHWPDSCPKKRPESTIVSKPDQKDPLSPEKMPPPTSFPV